MPPYLWPVLVVAFALSVAGTWAYRSVAIRRGILSNPNFRSLHQRPTPRGGGIAFSATFLLVMIGLWTASVVDSDLARALVVGGAGAAAFGFADDKLHLGAREKLVVQGLLAAWALGSLGGHPLVDLPLTPDPLDLAISWLALVWLLNLYNFIDGIDGMAASGAVLLCAIAVLVLTILQGDPRLYFVFGLLAACSLGFLVFNWPPASIFMGDSGSMFLGFCFSVLIVHTVSHAVMSVWTWLAMFGYFAADTTTTTIVRMFVAEKWYGEHRSHAYQNLARISGSHRNVVAGIFIYHVVWIAPLTIWSVVSLELAPLAAALALAPVVGLALRYGPLLSSS